MLRIWGRLSSVNVQKVVWCARELSLDHERIDVGGAFGGVDTPAFKAMNPNGMIPVIEDGLNDSSDTRFVLWESNAIVRYLSARYGPGNLYPLELHERADADRWMDWQTTSFSPSMVDAFLQLVRTPEDQRDATRIERSRQAKQEVQDAVLKLFAAEFAQLKPENREELADAIGAALSLDAWIVLRRQDGLSYERATAVWRLTLSALLEHAFPATAND